MTLALSASRPLGRLGGGPGRSLRVRVPSGWRATVSQRVRTLASRPKPSTCVPGCGLWRREASSSRQRLQHLRVSSSSRCLHSSETTRTSPAQRPLVGDRSEPTPTPRKPTRTQNTAPACTIGARMTPRRPTRTVRLSPGRRRPILQILHATLSPVGAKTHALNPTPTILNTQHHHYTCTPILYAILSTAFES